ncbi:hypothetical protein F5883DRAFT_71113 [Diaporthe sp. PMI_573]|nr:hypothetical protein F5883DRAFT_71113 [Diaporthaceae sp. PMI_573]
MVPVKRLLAGLVLYPSIDFTEDESEELEGYPLDWTNRKSFKAALNSFRKEATKAGYPIPEASNNWILSNSEVPIPAVRETRSGTAITILSTSNTSTPSKSEGTPVPPASTSPSSTSSTSPSPPPPPASTSTSSTSPLQLLLLLLLLPLLPLQLLLLLLLPPPLCNDHTKPL